MSCCGRGRQALTAANSRPGQSGVMTPVPFFTGYGQASASTVIFEYVGESGLAITGQGTGLRYRFPAKGSRANVDIKDRASFLIVPGLREVGR